MQDIRAKAERIVSLLTGSEDDRLQEVAKFDHQVTGATVAEDGRIFVNLPRWSEDVPVYVAEVMKDGTIKAYPNEEWNAWRNLNMAGVTPNDHFVTVQSVIVDGRGSLRVDDPAAPNTEDREGRPEAALEKDRPNTSRCADRQLAEALRMPPGGERDRLIKLARETAIRANLDK